MAEFPIRTVAFLIFYALVTPVTMIFGSEGSDRVKQALQSRYQITKTNLSATSIFLHGESGAHTIKTPGTVLVIRQNGLYGSTPKDTAASFEAPVYIENGYVSESRLTKDYYFKRGEKLYLTSVYVRRDRIFLGCISYEPYDLPKGNFGNRQPQRVVATLTFKFQKEVIAAADMRTIQAAIDAWVIPEEMVSKNPKPTDLPEKIELRVGMPLVDVIGALGQPKKRIQIEGRELLTYDAFTVIMANGIVAEIK